MNHIIDKIYTKSRILGFNVSRSPGIACTRLTLEKVVKGSAPRNRRNILYFGHM